MAGIERIATGGFRKALRVSVLRQEIHGSPAGWRVQRKEPDIAPGKPNEVQIPKMIHDLGPAYQPDAAGFGGGALPQKRHSSVAGLAFDRFDERSTPCAYFLPKAPF